MIFDSIRGCSMPVRGGMTGLRPGWNPCRHSMELEPFAISKSGVEKIFIIWPD
jgi:hypothetical protein